MLTVTLYTRESCSLCKITEEDLKSVQDQFPHKLVKIDIEKDHFPEFVDKIPVIEVGPYQVEGPIDKKTIIMTLGAAQDRLSQLDDINLDSHQRRLERGKQVSLSDRFFHWLSKRYMVFFNGFVALYLGLAILAPVLQSNGNLGSAKLLYLVYGKLCHQLSFRSWFIFGEQPAYPREIADVDNLVTYEQTTGFDPFDLDTAIGFLGNEVMGYKFALCQRDIAIYGSILLFGLLFAVTGRRLPSLPLLAWFILGIIPIGLDGVSQVISQLGWDIIPIRESTPLIRTITGGLFGFSTAWFGYPIVEEAMADTRKIMTVKIKAKQADQDE